MFNQNYIRDDKHSARGKDSKPVAKYGWDCMGEREGASEDIKITSCD